MSKWSEVRNEFVEVEDGVVTVFIDGWVSEYDDEEGAVIAKVYGSKDSEIKVEYIDEMAKSDEYAQEIIKESFNVLKEELEFLDK